MAKASEKRAAGNPEWKTQQGEPPPSPEDTVNHSSDYSLCPPPYPVMATDSLRSQLFAGSGSPACRQWELQSSKIGSSHSRRSSGGRCSLGKQGAHASHNSLVRFLRTGVLACAVSSGFPPDRFPPDDRAAYPPTRLKDVLCPYPQSWSLPRLGPAPGEAPWGI